MEPFKSHVEKLLSILSNKNLKAALIFSPANIYYFAGTDAPSLAIILDGGDVLLLSSRLEYLRAVEEHAIGDVYAFSRQTDVAEYEKVIRGDLYDAIGKLLEGLPPEKIGIGGAGLETKRKVAEKLGAEPVDITRDVVALRRQKDKTELATIREAARLAEQAMRRAIDALDRGVTELDVVAAVLITLLRSGARPSFDPIVAFGEHAAQPHAKPTQRTLKEGDVVKIDLGARVKGYCSDMTRTLIFGKPSQKQERILRAVTRAQEHAIESIRAGKAARDIYFVAYKALQEEGLHLYFNHGLGHGVGIEVHEEPYLNSESEALLLPGDVITVEPGVYMAGYLGVRVEDMVLVEEGGAEILTYFPRDYLI